MYLTATEAEARLQTRYNITAELTEGDVEAGESALEELAPFETPLDQYDTLPNALLDYVALYAYILATDELPGIQSENVGGTSSTYATPRQSQAAHRMDRLVAPYLQRRGIA